MRILLTILFISFSSICFPQSKFTVDNSGHATKSKRGTILIHPVDAHSQIIADHTVVDRYDDIPQQYINEVKKMLLITGGESHTLGIFDGLRDLETINPTYDAQWTYDVAPESYTDQHLRFSNILWGDLNNATGWISNSYGEEDWWLTPTAIARTKAGITYCNSNGLTISVFGFGQCYDSDYVDMTDYMTVTQGYTDYCADSIPTTVFFTTGPVDWAANNETGYLKTLAYTAIRNYVNEDESRILFDYADILCWDNNGDSTMSVYNGNPYPRITDDNGLPAGTGHISSVGEIRLGKAMWWMLARIAGWDGN